MTVEGHSFLGYPVFLRCCTATASSMHQASKILWHWKQVGGNSTQNISEEGECMLHELDLGEA